MDRITAKTNEKIKYAVKLINDASFRKRESRFVIEGLRLCEDAVFTDMDIIEVYYTEKAYEKYSDRIEIIISKAGRSFVISEDVADKLADTKSSQGIFCLCKTIDKFNLIDKIKNNGIYIAVENIQTPDNLGAVSRTAEALGLDGIIISGGCDIYNAKAQRASMGALFRLPVIIVEDFPGFIKQCRSKNMKFYAAVPDTDAVKITEMDKSTGIVCIVGNEGNGLTEDTIKACNDKVTVPMKGRAESLNVAAAAAVIMWEMVR